MPNFSNRQSKQTKLILDSTVHTCCRIMTKEYINKLQYGTGPLQKKPKPTVSVNSLLHEEASS